MFTFSKHAAIKKNLVSLLGNIFFGLQYKQKPFFLCKLKKGKASRHFDFCVDMINKRKTVGCYGLDTAIKVHLVERKLNI